MKKRDHHQVAPVIVVPDSSPKKTKTIKDFFTTKAQPQSTTKCSALIYPSLPQAWGKLTDPEVYGKRRRLHHALQHYQIVPHEQYFLNSKYYTQSFTTVFNDHFNRVPGRGNHSVGWGAGRVRSNITKGAFGQTESGGPNTSVTSESKHSSQKINDNEEQLKAVWEVIDDFEENNGNSKEIKLPVPTADEKGRSEGSQARRNAHLIVTYILGSDLLLNQKDREHLRSIQHELSLAASDLFWKLYQNPRPLYRVSPQANGQHPTTLCLVQELLRKGLVEDVAAEETFLLYHVYDLLVALNMKELTRLLAYVVPQNSFNTPKTMTRDKCLSILEDYIAHCLSSSSSSANLLARLGKDLSRFLLSSQLQGVKFVSIPLWLRKLLHRVFALFFLQSGYEAEDAVMLLKTDLSSLSFMPSIPRNTKDAGGNNNFFIIASKHGRLVDYVLALVDAFELAVVGGDRSTAYTCLHLAADFFLSSSRDLEEKEENERDGVEMSMPSFTVLQSLQELQHGYPHPLWWSLPIPLLKLVIMCLGRGINLLEREKQYSGAVHYIQIFLNANNKEQHATGNHMLLDVYRGHFWSRLVKDLCHLGRNTEALKACEEALKDPSVQPGEDRLFLQNKCVALAVRNRRWKRPSFPTLRSAQTIELQLDLRRSVAGKSVEDRALDYLLGEYLNNEAPDSDGASWRGVHCENGLYLTLYGLLMWDVIWYQPEGGHQVVHITPYQNKPHDFFTQGFATCRHVIAQETFTRIEKGYAAAILEETYHRYHNVMMNGVDWVTFTLSELQYIARGLGPAALSLICRTLFSNYVQYNHGLPDLLLWKECNNSPEVRLLEVKGPGDSLSLAQMFWIDKLKSVNVNIQICKILNIS